MIRRPPRSTHCISSAASDVYKRQGKSDRFIHIAAHVSNDGRHVLVAYAGSNNFSGRCDNTEASPCPQVYFVESLNGGLKWNERIPIDRLNKDKLSHFNPSIFHDKASGKVYISYRTMDGNNPNYTSHVKLAIKNAADNFFTARTVETVSTRFLSSAIGQTVDLRNSKRYFHLFADILFYSGRLRYYRSEDNGEK
eukprot:TRINITY_DN10568_c0_g1_i1.p1 TRINITY_DN10568_c0_g1~~TRINITY_DN10568_c0_g1_i1.p1  ORF type:complete len:202 (+),score=43.58 TRINITY_DN10568_c0_g1_i1:24-608(+)